MEDVRSREKRDGDEMVYVDYNKSELCRQAHIALVTEPLGRRVLARTEPGPSTKTLQIRHEQRDLRKFLFGRRNSVTSHRTELQI